MPKAKSEVLKGKQHKPSKDWLIRPMRSDFRYVNKIGPDAGEIHFYTGRSADPCPCKASSQGCESGSSIIRPLTDLLVKVGPLDKQQRYEYIILTQLLKYPVMILARDPSDFDAFHKEEVKRFLEDNNFYNSLTRAYGMITFLDHKECPDSYYYHLE